MLDRLFGSFDIEVRQGSILIPEMWKPKRGEELPWSIIQDRCDDCQFWIMRIGATESVLMNSLQDENQIALQSGVTPILSDGRLELPAPFLHYLGHTHNVVAVGVIQYFELSKDADHPLLSAGFMIDDITKL